MHQTFVLHTQKKTRHLYCVLKNHSNRLLYFILKTACHLYCILKKVHHLYCVLKKARHLYCILKKSTQKVGKKGSKKDSNKVGKKYAKKHIAIYTTHMLIIRKKNFLKHILEPVLLLS